MIDIHCHILPSVDDGPLNIDQSIRMAEIALKDGIHTIVASPHIKDRRLSSEDIRKHVLELRKELKKRSLAINIIQGADISSTVDIDSLSEFTINNSRYILFELPSEFNETLYSCLIGKIINKGIIPILTHPERTHRVLKRPDILMDFIRMGAFVQITSDSLTGGFGPEARDFSIYLLKNSMVHFIATDAHSAEYRRPVLSQGLKVAEGIIGRDRAYRLVTDNPMKVINNRAVL
jgi:protein-tyrosine phosphatase